MASIPWDMSKGNLDCLYMRTKGLRCVLPHELPPLSGPERGKSGTFLIRAGPSRAHERHEFPRKWLPSLGTCPKATWITSICEPTAYGASFPMNFRPFLVRKAENLGHFLYANYKLSYQISRNYHLDERVFLWHQRAPPRYCNRHAGIYCSPRWLAYLVG